jgi:hypothetical protein
LSCGGCDRTISKISQPTAKKQDSACLSRDLPYKKELLGGLFTPFKDLQRFADDNYTEVVITSREAWDRTRLPERVLELEEKGYICTPYPEKYEYGHAEGDILPQPAVKTVHWECALPYNDYKYLDSKEIAKKEALERQGYACKKEECLDENNQMTFVWFCNK